MDSDDKSDVGLKVRIYSIPEQDDGAGGEKQTLTKPQSTTNFTPSIVTLACGFFQKETGKKITSDEPQRYSWQR